MAKKKDYTKITCSCEFCDYDATTIVDAAEVQTMKRRIAKSMCDFTSFNSDEVAFNFIVEAHTNELPEEGTDILFKPKHAVAQHIEEEIDVIDLGE